jgi:hypothetical protein
MLGKINSTVVMKANLNEYALTAGLMMLFMSIAHAVYGETVVFSDLRFLNFDRALFATVYAPWHQMSFVLLISSIGLILSSFKVKLRSIQSFVLLVTLSNLLIFIISIANGTTIYEHSSQALVFQAWPQFFFFIILVLLIVLGIRKKEKTT